MRTLRNQVAPHWIVIKKMDDLDPSCFHLYCQIDVDTSRLLTGCTGRYGGGSHYTRVLPIRGRCRSHGSPANRGINGLTLTYITSLGPWPSGYSFSPGASRGKAFKLCRAFKICCVNHVRMFWFVFTGFTSEQRIHFKHLIQFSSHLEFSVHSLLSKKKITIWIQNLGEDFCSR